VSNELNIHHYEVERSLNGRNFDKAGIVITTSGNISGTVKYSWLDEHPLEGNNFYRIKSIGRNGEIIYSSIVKVGFTKGPSAITIYPNPVKGGMINLQINNMLAGEYTARIVNNIGQVVYAQKIQHPGENSVNQILAKQFLIPGSYHAEIIKPDHSVVTISFVNLE
jgi:hypothetical protein